MKVHLVTADVFHVTVSTRFQTPLKVHACAHAHTHTHYIQLVHLVHTLLFLTLSVL